MDIVTLGAALNGSAEYVNSHFKGGSNIQIVDNPDGTQTINASGEVSAEDTVAREAIVEHVLDKANPHEVTASQVGLGNVNNTSDIDKPVSTAMQTALNAKANTADVYSKNEVNTALGSKQNVITDLADIRSGAALGSTAVQPVSGKGLSTNDYTTAEKNKLAGIEAQANKTVVDDAFSSSSSNPVQNKVVKSALDGKQNTLTPSQLAAINSTATQAKIDQIETNKNNILLNAADIYGNWTKSKNKLINNAVTTTVGEAVFTVNADKTVSVYTTATTTELRSMVLASTSDNIIVDSSDIVSGTPITDKDVVIQFGVGSSGNIKNVPPTTGYTTAGVSGVIRYFSIAIRANVSISQSNPLVFKPMICTAADWQKSKEYFPNAMSNVELTAEAEMQDISNQIKTATGYTIDSLTKLYRQGNRVFGQVIISKDEGSFGVAQETIAAFKSGYKPKDIQIQSCGFGASAYNVQYLGYAYMQLATATSSAGSLIVKGYQSDVGSFVNLHVDFAI